jgi:hypothetical protein
MRQLGAGGSFSTPPGDARVGESSQVGAAQTTVFAVEIFFPDKSLTILGPSHQLKDKCFTINEIETLKNKTRTEARSATFEAFPVLNYPFF